MPSARTQAPTLLPRVERCSSPARLPTRLTSRLGRSPLQAAASAAAARRRAATSTTGGASVTTAASPTRVTAEARAAAAGVAHARPRVTRVARRHRTAGVSDRRRVTGLAARARATVAAGEKKRESERRGSRRAHWTWGSGGQWREGDQSTCELTLHSMLWGDLLVFGSTCAHNSALTRRAWWCGVVRLDSRS